MRFVSFNCETCGEFQSHVAQATFDRSTQPKLCQKCSGNAVDFKYGIRNAAVRELGFNTYADYLNSEIWARVRQMVLDRDGGKCVLCLKTAANVHHQSYAVDVLVGNELRLLHSLCRSCHEGIEFSPTGEKLGNDLLDSPERK